LAEASKPFLQAVSALITATVGVLAVFVVYGRSATSAPEPSRLDTRLAGPR
jgi:hypothetical protein